MGAGASTSHFIEEEVKILADFSSENAWAYDSEKWCVRAPPLSPPPARVRGERRRGALASRRQRRSATAAAAAAPARAASPSLAQADAAEL